MVIWCRSENVIEKTAIEKNIVTQNAGGIIRAKRLNQMNCLQII